MILADRVRQFVVLNYIEPARIRSERNVVVVARDVIKSLALKNRSAAVCNALDAEKFCAGNGHHISRRSGPKQGRTAAWVLGIELTRSVVNGRAAPHVSAEHLGRITANPYL